MQKLLFWIPQRPPEGVAFDTWTTVLQLLASVAVVLIAGGTFVTLLIYKRSARNLKPPDMHSALGPYTPMRWVWLSLVFGLLEMSVCVGIYPPAPIEGELAASLQLGLFVFLAVFVLSFVGILKIDALTPAMHRGKRSLAEAFRLSGQPAKDYA